MAKAIVAARPGELGHINLDRVLFLLEVTNEEIEAAGQCYVVKPPFTQLFEMFNQPYDYVIIIYGFHASDKSVNWKRLLVYHELRHVGSKGRLVEHTIEDFRNLLRTFGVDWTEDGDLPDVMRVLRNPDLMRIESNL